LIKKVIYKFWERKANKLQLMIKSINKRDYSCLDNFTRNNDSNMIEALRYLYPEKDGVYTRIVLRFLANPEFLKLANALVKSKVSVSIFQDSYDQIV
jgi:hypothetical protein